MQSGGGWSMDRQFEDWHSGSRQSRSRQSGDCQSCGSQSECCQLGGRCDSSCEPIHWLAHNLQNIIRSAYQNNLGDGRWEIRDCLVVGESQS